jgi:hypothetical protein
MTSAVLLAANAVFLIWTGFEVLDGQLSNYHGPFLAVVAAAHLLVGWYFLTRDGERHLFGLLATGTGIASLAMAAALQLDAPALPIAWTSMAVALTWLAVRRGHPYGALAGAVLYILAAGDLIWLQRSAERFQTDVAFLDGAGAAIAFFVAGVVAGVLAHRDLSVRSPLAALGLVTVAWCIAERLDGPAAVVALTALTATGIVTLRLLPELPTSRLAWTTEGLIPRSMATLDEWRPLLDRGWPGIAWHRDRQGVPVRSCRTGDRLPGHLLDCARIAVARKRVGLATTPARSRAWSH